MKHQRIRARRIEAMTPVRDAWHDLEHSYNVFMEKMGAAWSAIPAARNTPGAHMPLDAGVAASRQLASGMMLAAQSYEAIVAGHDHLAIDRDRLAPGITADGDLWPTNKSELDAPAVAAADDTVVRLQAA